jgi:hypothetical protein
MRRLAGNVWLLGAALIGVPASAQMVSSLTVSSDAFVGGASCTARLVLSEAAGPAGAVCVLLTTHPAAVLLPVQVVVPPGGMEATFPIYTLPIDAPLATRLGVVVNQTTTWVPLALVNGDRFRTRLALFRPDTGLWLMRDNADGSVTEVAFGEPGDQPLPTDYLVGDGLAQLAVFRRGTREWRIRRPDGTASTVVFGETDDVPAPGDYLGIGRAQIAVFRPSTREVVIRADSGEAVSVAVPFAQPGDQPVSANYLVTTHGQLAFFRPATYEWLIRNDDGSVTTIPFGQPGDAPVPANYLGTGRTQIAVFRPSTGEWLIRVDDGSVIRVPFGAPGDVPIQGDYLGLRRALLAVFRAATGEWLIRSDTGDTLRIFFGSPNDQPLPNFFAPRFGTP